MSPGAAGRPLVGERRTYRLHGLCHTRSTPLGGRIPVQTCMDPPLDIPGVPPPVDLVGRGGGQAVGDFGWTLTVTDCTTGWTEAGAVRTKAEVYVLAALESCLRRYPHHVLSLHADNGSKFINDEPRRFCDAHGIRFTRSHPWHKNDNCTVESKNWTLVRRCLGYCRFDTKGQIIDLRQLETLLTQRANVLQPSMVLQEKVRTGSRIQKRYRPRLTPLRRLLQAPEVSDQAKARLLRQLRDVDPISLQRDIHILQTRLLGKTSQDISPGAVTRRTISL